MLRSAGRWKIAVIVALCSIAVPKGAFAQATASISVAVTAHLLSGAHDLAEGVSEEPSFRACRSSSKTTHPDNRRK